MQQKEDCPFYQTLTVQKERFDVVQQVKHAAKTELHFLGDIDYIERRFDLVKWVRDAAKRELRFLGDIDCIEKKVSPGKIG